MRVGSAADQSYYYLGRAAEGLGYPKAALAYYSAGAKTTYKCDSPLVNVCDGFKFPDDFSRAIARINGSKSSSVLANSTDSQDRALGPPSVGKNWVRINVDEDAKLASRGSVVATYYTIASPAERSTPARIWMTRTMIYGGRIPQTRLIEGFFVYCATRTYRRFGTSEVGLGATTFSFDADGDSHELSAAPGFLIWEPLQAACPESPPTIVATSSVQSIPRDATVSSIPSAKDESRFVTMVEEGGVYEVPVTLNGVLRINFIVDSGAAEVSITPDVALTLIRTKTVTGGDFLPGRTFQFADGSSAKSSRFIIRSLKIGDKTVHDVACSISSNLEAPMLLGQSALKKLKTFSIDYDRHVMILGEN
jgi:aspartyl protease family protein